MIKLRFPWGKRNYLLISLIALLTLSRPGLAPHSAAISSMGTELNTIDVITLKKSPKFVKISKNPTSSLT